MKIKDKIDKIMGNDLIKDQSKVRQETIEKLAYFLNNPGYFSVLSIRRKRNGKVFLGRANN